MLISREELRYPFQGVQFNLNEKKEREFLGWIFDQFLYGEVTGIQCGHWLYRAPHLNAAAFLAKQAGEELSHVKRVLRIFTLLGEKPKKAHWAIRFLTTGMMGSSWGEHVAIEMALGEGLVLGAFYALADTIPNPEIQKILNSAAVEEERHVEFGERETRTWLAQNRTRGERKFLLGQALLQAVVLRWLKSIVLKKIAAQLNSAQEHPLVSHFEKFYEHSVRNFELRMERLGLSDCPLNQLGPGAKCDILLHSVFFWLKTKLKFGRFKHSLLTDTYLNDPSVRAELERARLSSVEPE